jgi:hypothetical protein
MEPPNRPIERRWARPKTDHHSRGKPPCTDIEGLRTVDFKIDGGSGWPVGGCRPLTLDNGPRYHGMSDFVKKGTKFFDRSPVSF